jgi:hypothetical protein
MLDFENNLLRYAQSADLRAFADFLDEGLNADELLAYMSDRDAEFVGRKEFCELLGIGESTLSGWLKGDRIPKMAKLVVGLMKARRLDRDDISQMEQSLSLSKIRERIILDGDHYMIVEFSKDNIGRIIARNIPDKESAEKLLSHHALLSLLDQIRFSTPLMSEDDYEMGFHIPEVIEETLVKFGYKPRPIFSEGPSPAF